MKKEIGNKIRFWFGVFLGVFTAALAVFIIAEAADLYYGATGEQIYTPEAVGERLGHILIPAVLWLIAVIVGYVLTVLWPLAEEKPRPDAGSILRRMKKGMPQAEGEEFLAERKRMRRFELTRIVIWSVCSAFAVVAGVMTIVYLANVKNFSAADISAEILDLVRNVAPWVGASFLLFVGAVLYEHFSAKYELACMKKLLVLGKGAPVEPVSLWAVRRDALIAGMGSEKVKLVLRIALAALAVVFIVLGVLNGGARDVLYKAINICQECIGLG